MSKRLSKITGKNEYCFINIYIYIYMFLVSLVNGCIPAVVHCLPLFHVTDLCASDLLS